MTRKAALLALALLLALAVTAGAQETDCSGQRAWPDGPHLSEKNDFIRTIFFAHWKDRACEQWAEEHRNAAVVGLRKLGWKVDPPKKPVLKVDELTFRGVDNQHGTVNLDAGCYGVWFDVPSWTPERQIEEGWKAQLGYMRVRLFDPEDPEKATSNLAFNGVWGILIVDDPVRLVDTTFIHIKPGTWGWQTAVSWKHPNTEWELRFIPIEYTLAPWDSFWKAFPQGHESVSECPAGM